MALPLFQIGPYRIVRKLGEGGMGEVFEAVHLTIERQVAIKILRSPHAREPGIQQRLLNEARAVNLIKHPGLVQVSDLGRLSNGSPYIVMEYLAGETLAQRFHRMAGRMVLPDALHTTWQVASALAAAHEVGIIHRDLKPENIMIVPDPVVPTGDRAKLLDFGIARFDPTLHNRAATTGGGLMGTPTYMSPEQCRGVGKIDAKSDVYSLGVMLFQLLSGRPPFVSQAMGELIILHTTAEPPDILSLAPQIPPALAALVHELLAKLPQERPTMAQVVSRLEDMGAHQFSRRDRETVTPALPSPSVFGLEPGRLSGSLADLLGPELEAERDVESWSLDPAETPEVPVPSPPIHDRPTALQTDVLARAKTFELASPTALSPPQKPPPEVASAPAEQPAAAAASDGPQPVAPPKGRRRWPTLLAALCLVAGLGALSFRQQASQLTRVAPPQPPAPLLSAPTQTAPARPTSPPPPARALVSWFVDTIPSGARIVRADTQTLLGMTPWRSEQPQGEGSLLLRLQHPGYAEKEIRLAYQRSSQQTEALTPLPPGPPAGWGIRRPLPVRRAPPAVAPRPSQSLPVTEKKPDFEVIE